MRRKRLFSILTLLLFFHFGALVGAASPPPESGQSHSQSGVGKKAGGQAGQKGGIYVVGRAFKKAGHEMKEGFKAAGRGIEKGGKAAGRGFKKAGREIKEFFKGE